MELYRFVENAHPSILVDIREKKTLDDALKAKMDTAIKDCKVRFASAK